MIDQPCEPAVSEATSERDPLDVVAEEFAERCRRGEQPALEEYLARYPQWAAELRELLPAAAMMEELRRHKQAARAVASGREAIERLGDYRIVRELGRGGMGIVYEAVQESLGRHVALKVLPRHSLLDPKKLARFQREAQAAAALHHSNIVPVFGVGEHDGLHYYVMQLIPGQGLHEVLARLRRGEQWPDVLKPPHSQPLSPEAGERGAKPPPPHPHTLLLEAEERGEKPTPHTAAPLSPPRPPEAGEGLGVRGASKERAWREVARLGVQAADALEYAHQHGTLHRDIKPANILLDPRGTVWLTDFGLAKLSEQNQLTSTGDLVGTLQYLAPESLHGQTDARSDVYSLGLTLYELLTLAPPFPESNPARLLQQVSSHDPVGPRKINPAIPRDLETIILKAIAREPARRYQTAGELAEDLRSFLADRPIRARRISAPERLRRWYRHNRLVARLLAALVLVFVAGFAGVVWKWREAEAAVNREAQQRQIAEHATDRADANVRLSLQAFEDIFDDLAPREPARSPRPREVEQPADLLQDVLQFYDQFAAANETNSRVQIEAAKAHLRVGDIHLRRGESDKAAASYDRALAILEELTMTAPEDREYRYELAETCMRPDPRATGAAALADAEKRLTRAASLAEQLHTEDASVSRYVLLAARIRDKLGELLRQQGRKADAEAEYRRAVDLLKLSGEPGRRHVPAAHALGRARTALADLLLEQDRPADARAVLEESIADLQKLRKADPYFRPSVDLLAEQYRTLASVLTRLNEPKKAAEMQKHAEEVKKRFRPAPPGPRLDRGKRRPVMD